MVILLPSPYSCGSPYLYVERDSRESTAPMTEPLRISDAERRARIITRHHLGRTASDVVEAARALVALHSSDPATPYLSAAARVPNFATADLDRALLSDRTLCRLHAMRRTLFVVPTDTVALFEAGASRDVARRERRRVEGWVADEIGPQPMAAFLARLEQDVLEALGDGGERRTQELSAAIPDLGMEITLGSGKWTTRSPLSSRLLFLMAMDGLIVRTRPVGSWRSSQYHWAATSRWLDTPLRRLEPGPARAELARQYLAAYGPATLADLRWWTGWTAKQATAAVAALGAVHVRLDGGGTGVVLPGDTKTTPAPPPHVALLPALDSTPMGWKERDWFLGGHAGQLFDRNGNIGPSVWVDGRVVGGWAQRPDGVVLHRLLEDVPPDSQRRVVEEAAARTAWLAGVVVVPRFRTPLERQLCSGDEG